MPLPEVIGPCRLVRVLGRGGMGTVHLALMHESRSYAAAGERVALKLISAESLSAPGAAERVEREARIGLAVEHPSVVRTFEAGAVDLEGVRRPWLVLELVEGRSLVEVLRELGALPEALLRDVAIQLAAALAAVHAAGVVHRDVKPGNVLITSDHRVKLMDLGIAFDHAEGPEAETDGWFLGTLRYASPEQLGAAEIGPSSDLHALGIVLHECATGRHPLAFGDAAAIARQIVSMPLPRLGEACPELSPFLEEVVATLVEKHPLRRFASAEELRRVLDEGEESSWWKRRADELCRTSPNGRLRAARPRRLPLVGRDDESAKLHWALEAARGGRGQVVLLVGDQGAGKSRLAEHVAWDAEDSGAVTVLRGSARTGDTAGRPAALARALGAHFGEESLAGALGALLPDSKRLAPGLAAALLGSTPADGSEPLGADAVRSLACDAVRALGVGRPLMLVLEDLHADSAEGRAAALAVARAVHDRPVLLLLTSRPGEGVDDLAPLLALAHAQRIDLGRLGDEAVRELAGLALAAPALAQRYAHEIAERAAGNALFALEMARDVRSRVVVPASEESADSDTAVLGPVALPGSVSELLAARLSEVDASARAILDAAAVQGLAFDADLCAAALGTSRLEALQGLARLERRWGLVRAAGSSFAFDHHLLRDALIGALDPARKRGLHASLATAIAAREGAAPQDGATAALLAEHWLRGGEGARALPLVVRALRWLAAARRHEALLELAELALAATDVGDAELRHDVLVEQAESLGLLGLRERERVVVDLSLEAAAATGDERRMLRSRLLGSKLLFRLARHRESLDEMEAVRRRADELADAALAGQVASNLGSSLASVGRHDDAMAQYRHALEHFRRQDDVANQAAMLGNLGTVSFFQGRLADAEGHLRESVALAAESQAIVVEGRAHGNLGNVMLALGRLDEALECWRRCVDVAAQSGNRSGEMIFTCNLAMLSSETGRHDEARRLCDRALALALEQGSLLGRGVVHANRGLQLLALGRLEEAEAEAAESLAIAEETGMTRHVANALALLGDVRAARGDERAREDYERVRAMRVDLGDREGLAMVLTSVGRLEARAGRVEEAVLAFEEAAALVEENALADPGPLPAAWLASLGRRDASSVVVPETGLPRVRAEALVLLDRAEGREGERTGLARRLVESLAPADPAERAIFVEGSPLARLVR